uniref:TIR domain-containing protein n=3 Tax=Ciona intestinalis TaxID=7719 RepID=H2XPZ8_CIOIN
NLQVEMNESQHVMISYQWDVQPMMLQVRNKLKENKFKVWIDVDRVEGSILSAMADAVENASVVVVAMSEKYKNSNPCRTEAEYAYKLQKPIVPLLLDESYKPDGWLGALVGMQMYFNFSDASLFEANCPKMIKTISSKVYKQPEKN